MIVVLWMDAGGEVLRDIGARHGDGEAHEIDDDLAVAHFGAGHLGEETQDPTIDQKVVAEHAREVDAHRRRPGRGRCRLIRLDPRRQLRCHPIRHGTTSGSPYRIGTQVSLTSDGVGLRPSK